MLINPFFFFGLLGISTLCMVSITYAQVRKWWAWHKERQRRLLLRASPTVLKNKLREQQRVIDHLEDVTLRQRTDNDALRTSNDELRAEVRLLNKRNQFMANEVRCDEAKPTEVLRPVRPYRRAVEEYRCDGEELTYE
jgi:hypothetical protein